MCLGLHFAYMQMKLFMHHLLTSVRVEIADGYAPDPGSLGRYRSPRMG